MSDFDPCACITQSALIQRIIQLLRNSQESCTDSQCFQDLTRPDDGLSTLAMMFIWILFAIGLYIARPASMRNSQRANDCEPTDSDGVSSSNPPPPPPPPPSAGQT
eukprot:gene7823-9963_t